MNEKKNALDVLEAALNRVSEAMEVIGAYAKANGIPVGGDKLNHGDEITMEKLAEIVADQTGFNPGCIEEILDAAFHLMVEYDLRIDGGHDDE
jgi:hypothetical protein